MLYKAKSRVNKSQPLQPLRYCPALRTLVEKESRQIAGYLVTNWHTVSALFDAPLFGWCRNGFYPNRPMPTAL